MTWRDPGAEWNDLWVLQVLWLPLHPLRQAVERARLAPDGPKGDVLHDDSQLGNVPTPGTP